jgi:hypothetical protein
MAWLSDFIGVSVLYISSQGCNIACIQDIPPEYEDIKLT